jgi:hypothetical protein
MEARSMGTSGKAVRVRLGNVIVTYQLGVVVARDEVL